jgi:hypothetical protein
MSTSFYHINSFVQVERLSQQRFKVLVSVKGIVFKGILEKKEGINTEVMRQYHEVVHSDSLNAGFAIRDLLRENVPNCEDSDFDVLLKDVTILQENETKTYPFLCLRSKSIDGFTILN